MTQQSTDDKSTSTQTTTPPTTPVAMKKQTCDCDTSEKSSLEEEALSAVREMAFAVITIAISEMLPRTSQLLFINVTTLENSTYCIELTGKGWRIASNRQDCMNGDFRQLNIHTNYYETLYSLMDTISPMYRDKFGGQLISKLSKLAESRSEE